MTKNDTLFNYPLTDDGYCKNYETKTHTYSSYETETHSHIDEYESNLVDKLFNEYQKSGLLIRTNDGNKPYGVADVIEAIKKNIMKFIAYEKNNLSTSKIIGKIKNK